MAQENKPEIKIADPYLDAMKAVKDEIGTMKTQISWGMTFVIGILMIGFLTLLFMVATMVIDAIRFNTEAYKENTIATMQASKISQTPNMDVVPIQ